MWQREGHAILYVYMSTGSYVKAYNMQRDDYKRATKADSNTGHGVWHGTKDFQFLPGKNTVTIEVRMNTPGVADGILGLRINETTKTLNNVVLREDPNELLTSFRMTSFYGGSSSDWGPRTNQVFHFRNFSFLKVDS